MKQLLVVGDVPPSAELDATFLERSDDGEASVKQVPRTVGCGSLANVAWLVVGLVFEMSSMAAMSSWTARRMAWGMGR
ncbi:MAG: hypothetical protein QF733_01405 [Phycisphaerales bacterium]|nr:hypothetical protein [Phycisphaerales bacterium]